MEAPATRVLLEGDGWGPPRQPAVQSPALLGDLADVVDLFDAAAHIESRGHSDRTVSAAYGYNSVFDLAVVIFGQRNRQDEQEQASSPALDVRAGWMRAAVLICGALLGGLVQMQLGAGSLEMIVAGCAGWVLGQAVAGVVWHRLRFDPMERAAGHGGVVALVCAGIAVVVAISLLLTGGISLTGAFLLLGWVAYALSMSILTVMNRVSLPLLTMVSAVTLQALVSALGHSADAHVSFGPMMVLPAVAAIVVIVLQTVRAVRSEQTLARPDLSDVRGLTVPVTQAILLAGALVIALSVVPDSHGTAFVTTSVLAVALTDPGIVALRGRLWWFAHRSTSLLWSRWFAWGLACLAVVVVAAIAAGLVVLIVMGTGADREQLSSTVVGAVLFSVFATLSSVLTAFGAQVKGLVPAALAVLVMLVIGSTDGLPAVLISIGAAAAALGLLIHLFSDARVFA
ncbi:hypothetical protein QYM41_04550 [Kocuria sp. CPCC 205268]|uniref:hypothetical protein n=1 Tax=Kocuria oxytropis TaxID=3058913 RepID=UPI0034D699D0